MIGLVLLNTNKESLAYSGKMLRMDPPRDTRNSLGWHQDQAYFKLNSRAENAIVAWIPLQDITAEMQGIAYCPGSHKNGLVSSKKLNSDKQNSSEQNLIQNCQLESYKKAHLSIRRGDVAFFNMNLIHKSGENKTNRVRFTAGLRFHNMNCSDFRNGRYKFEID